MLRLTTSLRISSPFIRRACCTVSFSASGTSRSNVFPVVSNAVSSAALVELPLLPTTTTCAHMQSCIRSSSTTSSSSSSSSTGFAQNPLHKKLDGLIHQARIVVFLTGTPSEPRCGFTVRMVDLLEQLPIKYEFVNIMEDEEVCEGLKTYSQWPTYPQLYIDGELIGGWDITRQMVMDGSLIKILSEKKLLLDD